MTNLNNDFMESYKHLDKICKEIFNSEKGVTTYIDTMKEVNDGNRYVPLWNKTLYKLKHYRHIRNNYVHEVGTSQYDICTRDDIEWLNNRREKSSYKAVEDVKYIRYTEGGEGEQLQYQNVNSKSDDGEGLRLVNIILKFLIIMGISLAVVLFIMLMIS